MLSVPQAWVHTTEVSPNCTNNTTNGTGTDSMSGDDTLFQVSVSKY